MGEHRVDQVGTRTQPVPRPLPPPRAEDLTPHAVGTPAHRPPVRKAPRHWRRRLVRELKSTRGRWVLATLACVVVLVVGLLTQGFLHSPAPAVSVPNAAESPGVLDSASPLEPSPSKSPSKGTSGSGQGGLVQDPVGALRNALPDNPLNHLQTGALHNVTVSASSPGRMAVLGYLVPTGFGSAYGSVHTRQHSWSISQQAIGKGYLAAVFIQTDRTGVPITCTVTVDGRVTSRETAASPYGRAVCIG